MSNTRKLVYIALLSAISFVLSYLQLHMSFIPGASFLSWDLTVLPILIGLFMFGLGTGFTILIVRSILWLILNNQGVNTYIGLPMNFVAIAVFILLFWFLLRRKFNLSHFVLAAVLGTIALTAAMLVLNYVYAIPLYAKFAGFNIMTMFKGGVTAYMWVVLFFNLIEGMIYSVAFAAIYWALRGIKVVKFINA